jgi:hypothetical protein
VVGGWWLRASGEWENKQEGGAFKKKYISPTVHTGTGTADGVGYPAAHSHPCKSM